MVKWFFTCYTNNECFTTVKIILCTAIYVILSERESYGPTGNDESTDRKC